MTKNVFVTDDFLLGCEAARVLYHNYAEGLPIVDFHSHLPPAHIAQDHQFDNLAQLWLVDDHYAWRAMRANGVDERYITGEASDWEKFLKWAETVPKTLGNPLYHWVHMELKHPFDIGDRLFGPDTAEGIWKECGARLAQEEFSCRGILRKMKVALVCTTDDPCDSLEHHQSIAADARFEIQVLPTFRPDRGWTIDSPARFNEWVDRLAQRSNVEISDFNSYLEALRKRHDAFHAAGCRASDHGMATVYAEDYRQSEIEKSFEQLRSGKRLSPEAAVKFRSAMLHEFAVMNWEKGWVQQLHIGALRNANTRMLQRLGPDVGCDSIGDANYGVALARFLARLEQEGQLTKTILYNINPRDNELVASMTGNFQDGQIPGKIQFGKDSFGSVVSAGK